VWIQAYYQDFCFVFAFCPADSRRLAQSQAVTAPDGRLRRRNAPT
jgi:hypothetical protein